MNWSRPTATVDEVGLGPYLRRSVGLPRPLFAFLLLLPLPSPFIRPKSDMLQWSLAGPLAPLT